MDMTQINKSLKEMISLSYGDKPQKIFHLSEYYF